MQHLDEAERRYLKKHLIAYIGNKRGLQGFLAGAFGEMFPGASARGRVFLDPFAGSGAVTRLARVLGFAVRANDWERYAYLLNFAHLCVEASELPRLYRPWGGLAGVLEHLNALTAPPPGQAYISRHYAPVRTDRADYRTERLFYTRENALRIDAVRSRIEELYPGEQRGSARKEKALLLASLLYQCATHTNTSGVFKACHKGFGGHGADALGRIMAPVRLEPPVLIRGDSPAEAFCLEAHDFVRGRSGDLCYLDPPYNQHQYGSNYHLLNSVALWDRPPVSGARGADGRLLHKAGIRRDWTDTRSAYCYRHTAPGALQSLLEAIDAPYLALSYNTDGIIPFDQLVELLSVQGRLRVLSNGYVAYRGGRQSIRRRSHTVELLLIVDRNGRTRSPDRRRIARALALKRALQALQASYVPERVQAAFPQSGRRAGMLQAPGLRLPMPELYRFSPDAAESLQSLGTGQLQGLCRRLKPCACGDGEEEIDVLLSLTRAAPHDRSRLERQRRILRLLRKFAHRKYQDQFLRTLSRLKEAAAAETDLQPLRSGLETLEELAWRRFKG